MRDNKRRAIGLRKWSLCLAASLTAACGSDDKGGSLSVALDPEETILDGLAAGDGAEDIEDGWSVRFARYIAVVGPIEVSRGEDEAVVADDVYAVDLTQLPEAGLPLWQFEDLQEGRWDFSFTTPVASSEVIAHSSVSAEDLQQMVDNGWTYIIEGTLSKATGESCPPAELADVEGATPNGSSEKEEPCYDAAEVAFSFGVPAEMNYTLCQIDGIPGVAISSGQTQTVSASLHGDHIFFRGFPDGDEGGVTRLAQWLADSDLNLDGSVTNEELRAIAPSQLAEIDDTYALPANDSIQTMYDYVSAQLQTQGHFQGEGECGFDGVFQEHHHEDEDDHDEDDHEE